MPDPQDFDRLVRLVDVVIDQVMIPQHFAGTGTLFDGLPDERSLPRFQGAVEQLIADAVSDPDTSARYSTNSWRSERKRSLRMTL